LNENATLYEVLIDERVERFLDILDEFEKNPIRAGSGLDVQ
jgi:hypothetical protein